MSFAHPLLLLGLLGAALPVVIHLINRRRPRKQPFPAMQLLLASVERVQRQWRLRRFLLLALRVLLLAALALAAAGPLIGEDSERARSASQKGPQRIAFVLDASLSMRARYDGQTVFARALAELRERIDRLGEMDQAVLVTTGRPPRVLVERPIADPGRLLRAIDKLEPSWGPAGLAEAISAGVIALAPPKSASPEASEADRAYRVVVLSDLARPAIDGAASLDVPRTESVAVIELVDLLAQVSPSARDNHGFVSASAAAVASPTPRTVEINARVQSYVTAASPNPEPRDLTLWSESGALVRSVIEIAPGALAQKSLRHAFDRAGRVPARLEVEPDALAEDDEYFVSVDVRRQVRLLIVDGDPSGVAKEDEAFYLQRALAAGASDQPAPKLITADDLARTDLEPFDVIALAGVPALAREDAERVVAFVNGGGGLFVSSASGMDLGEWNAGLGSVLPRRLRGFKQVTERPLAFTEPQLDHPVMRLFEGEALGGLLTTETEGFVLLEPERERPMTTLLALEGGGPALVASTAGQGRVVLLTTSIDRDLSDLPIRPAFVPLVRQLVLYLGDALDTDERAQNLVGQPRDIAVPAGSTRLEVRDPQGRVERFGAGELRSGNLRYEGTTAPGHYAVSFSMDGASEPFERTAFAVNVDPLESDLRPVPPDEAAAVLRGEATLGEGDTVVAGSALARRFDAEGLVTFLLLLMGLAFVGESALTAIRVGR